MSYSKWKQKEIDFCLEVCLSDRWFVWYYFQQIKLPPCHAQTIQNQNERSPVMQKLFFHLILFVFVLFFCANMWMCMCVCVSSSVQESCTSVAWSRTCTVICPNSLHPGTGTRAAWPLWTWMGDSPTWLLMPSTGWVRWNEAAMVSDGDPSASTPSLPLCNVYLSYSNMVLLCQYRRNCAVVLQCIVAKLAPWSDVGLEKKERWFIFLEWESKSIDSQFVCYYSLGKPVRLKHSAAISPSKSCNYFKTIIVKIAEEWGHCLLSSNLSVSIGYENRL